MTNIDNKNATNQTPFEVLGAETITKITKRFYEVMAEEEKEVASAHKLDENGKIEHPLQEKFALFLIGWLGGPQIYIERHGHPRLRARHAHVRINKSMRDGWLRAMAKALDDIEMSTAMREYLNERFYVMADHLINV